MLVKQGAHSLACGPLFAWPAVVFRWAALPRRSWIRITWERRSFVNACTLSDTASVKPHFLVLLLYLEWSPILLQLQFGSTKFLYSPFWSWEVRHLLGSKEENMASLFCGSDLDSWWYWKPRLGMSRWELWWAGLRSAVRHYTASWAVALNYFKGI